MCKGEKPITVADRLKYIMETRNLKQVDILRLCDSARFLVLDRDVKISKSDLSQYVSGKTEPGTDKALLLSLALDVNFGWLMGFDVPMDLSAEERDAIRRSPVFSAAAGEGVLNDGYPSETADFRLDPDQALFTVKGRSMEPTLQDGDTVVVTIQNVIDYPRQLALVKVNGNESTIKRVEIKDDGLLLIGDNVDVYAPHFFTAHEVQTLPVTIEGIVKRLIREID